jgi:hypothetical protein
MFNPAYLVSRGEGQPALLRVAKQPAMLEGKFRIDAVAPAQDQQADLAVLGVLMMLLLERARG